MATNDKSGRSSSVAQQSPTLIHSAMPPRLWLPPGTAAKATAAITAKETATKSPLVTSSSTTISTPRQHLSPRVINSEALSLYREILRTAKHFHWKDPVTGRPYNRMLREQAQQEFREARHETDPLIIARLLVTGRDCVQQVQNKFNAATQAAWKRIETDNQDAGRQR